MNLQSKIVFGRWIYGGSIAYLVFSADQQFEAVDGEIVQQGRYRRVACVVAGNDVTIPLIANIPATTDSVTDRNSTWTTWFEDAAGTRRMEWLAGFQLSHVFVSPALWADIFTNNNPPTPQLVSPGISYDQAVLLIQEAISNISPSVLASGSGTLTAAQSVTILDSHVAADSPIRLLPKTDTITGELRVFNRIAGVSFNVVSSEGGDHGNFRWEIYP